MVRIASVIRVTVCADVLCIKSVCFRRGGYNIGICFIGNYGPTQLRKFFHNLLRDVGLRAVFQLHIPIRAGAARIGLLNAVVKKQDLIARLQASEHTFFVLAVTHDNGRVAVDEYIRSILRHQTATHREIQRMTDHIPKEACTNQKQSSNHTKRNHPFLFLLHASSLLFLVSGIKPLYI